ncbi:hypothetical protein GFS24_20790 [Chitinophaga sp. SYP-B3965]|uniref:hypothetical protein n=1 Tax=Chitinophaga sp. SYP-B3965 TaxID=2663120 RepID=UPI0012997178|nr:hypothetical protein [Chitinophaga sp. SYP-B3965]
MVKPFICVLMILMITLKKGERMRKVKLRTKKISNGRKSLYLDVYPPVWDSTAKKFTRKYYLKLFVYEAPVSLDMKQHNKEILYLAEIILAKHQLNLHDLNQYWKF